MLWFLADRRALGLTLLGGDESPGSSSVAADGITARRWSGGAASLVHTVMLARHMADLDLEALAFAKVDRLGAPQPGGRSFVEAVAHWAKNGAAWCPVNIGDLVALPRPKWDRD